MESAIIGALLKCTLPKVLKVLSGSRDVRSIQSELRYIEAAIQDHPKKTGKDTSHLRAAWIEDLRLFAFDIEDCVDRFLQQCMPEDGEAGLLLRSARAAKKTVFTRTWFSLKIRKLKTRSEEIHRRLKRYIEEEAKATPDGAVPIAGAPAASSAQARCGAPAAVGMDEPLMELLELVREHGRPSERKLRVISVGFHGIGKTLLARGVYNHGDVCHLFPLRVWVSAAGKGSQEVLQEILDQVLQNGASTSTNQIDSAPAGTHSALASTSSNANGIIPQIEENGVEEAGNGESTSTGVHGVSTWLRWLQLVWWTLATILLYIFDQAFSVADMVRASFAQVDSADNHGVTANTSDSTKIVPQVDQNKTVQIKRQANNKCKDIQEDIYNDAVYDTALIEQHLGSCLKNKRYLIVIDGMQTEELCNITSVFPVVNGVDSRIIVTTTIKKIARRCSSNNGRVYKMKTLDDNDSEKLFFEVFSKGKCSIADATELQASALLKKCDGLPLAVVSKASFLKSDENLTKSKCEDACRKLCAPEICEDTLGRMHGVLVSSYESLCSLFLQQCLLYFCMFPLAVFPTGDAAKYEATLNFAKYDLLRVLDLEECDGLNDGHLENICNLVFLKYLSLGGCISEVPKKITKLQWLETLDLRRTKIEKVPVEVIQLPQLKHLLVKFQLIEGDCGKKNPEYLSKRSALETLSGFVTGESEGFPQLMSHMKRLRKVKIWCKSTANKNYLNHLEEAIKVFIRDGNEWPHRSLSIDLQECSDPFLVTLQAPGSLGSLKLCGNLRRFPQFVTRLNRIEELCLSSTNLSRGVLLSGSRLDTLKYLKLPEDNMGPLEIRPKHFPSLQQIWLVGLQSLHDVTTGTLPHLSSLHMICESLDGLAGIEIACLEGLKELRLHSRVDQGTKDAWKEAARVHPNRPDVLTDA